MQRRLRVRRIRRAVADGHPPPGAPRTRRSARQFAPGMGPPSAPASFRGVGVDPRVRLQDVAGGADLADDALLEPHDRLADLGDLVEAVADEDHGPAGPVKPGDLLETPRLEVAVDDRQD